MSDQFHADRHANSGTGIGRTSHSRDLDEDVSSIRATPPAQQISGDLLLNEAGRVFDQLRIRLNELEHREKKLDEKSRSLDKRHQDFTRWVKQTQDDLKNREEQLAQRETTAEHNQQRFQADTTRLQSERDQFLLDQKQWQEQCQKRELQYQETEAELDQLRSTRLDEIERVQREADELIADKTEQFEEFCKTQLEEISTQQAQTTRRLKMQEDHLNRLRSQFEQQKKQAQVESQRSLQSMQADREQQRRLRKQMQRSRQLLDQRFLALERQESHVHEQVQQQQSQIRHRLEELDRDQQEWFVYRQQFESRLQEQQDLLNRQQDFILYQQERLQRVRTEIETSHRDTLLLRLQTEAFRSEIAVEQGKHFDETHARELEQQIARHDGQTIEQQKQLAESLQNDFQKMHQFLEEISRQETAVRRWMTDGLIKWEHQKLLAQQEREKLIEQREKWNTARQEHIEQSRQAEQIIRDLLQQLESSNDTENRESKSEVAQLDQAA